MSIYGDAVEEAGSILWQSYLFFFVAALGRTGIAMPPTAILGSNTMVPSAVLERFGAAVSVALEVSSASRVSLALALAGMMLEGPVAARAALIDAAGAVVAAGAALR